MPNITQLAETASRTARIILILVEHQGYQLKEATSLSIMQVSTILSGIAVNDAHLSISVVYEMHAYIGHRVMLSMGQ